MQKFNVPKTFLILTLLSLCMSCENNIKTLEKDFNSAFTRLDIDQSDLIPDDDDFDETLMLDEIYTVKVSGNTGMFQVSAPKSNSYKWSLFDPANMRDASYKIPTVNLTERYFIIEYSTSSLEKGKTYLINLVVTDKEGKRYSDSAQLIFCQWYDSNTVDNLVTEITSEEEKKASADESEEESDETLEDELIPANDSIADNSSPDKSEEENQTSTDSSEKFTDEISEPRTSEESI